MKALANVKLVEMLQLQSRLNSMVNVHWLAAKNPWTRAIWIEAAEGMEHLGWKWWKKQESNVEQTRIELIDIWHFALSDALQTTNGNVEAAAASILVSLDDSGGEFNIMGKRFRIQDQTTPVLIDMLASLAAWGFVFYPALGQLFENLSMTWDDVYRTYVAKNVLNIFRQANGYKEGTYVKVWAGAEDNVHLEQMMNANPQLSPEQLLDLLGTTYRSLVPQ